MIDLSEPQVVYITISEEKAERQRRRRVAEQEGRKQDSSIILMTITLLFVIVFAMIFIYIHLLNRVNDSNKIEFTIITFLLIGIIALAIYCIKRLIHA